MAVMSDRSDEAETRRDALPPLAGEEHVCEGCRLSYAKVSVDSALEVVLSIPAAVRDAVSSLPTEALRLRSGTGGWSVTEYVCHLRDVYATYTVRLHRARTEDQPALEPMLNDLRARRFRYNELAVDAVADELAANVAGFRDEVAHVRPDQWERVVTRLPGEQRTTRWLVRQAMHEGQHHLNDIRRTCESVIAEI